jgi:hypothetical protein
LGKVVCSFKKRSYVAGLFELVKRGSNFSRFFFSRVIERNGFVDSRRNLFLGCPDLLRK